MRSRLRQTPIIISSILISLSIACGRYEYEQGLKRACNGRCKRDNKKHYLTEDHLPFYELKIKNSKFYYADHRPADKSGIYAMDHSGHLYFKNLETDKGRKFFHSYFLAGQEVACAGWMVFDNGKLLLINNNSGHYLPSAKNFFNALRMLSENGADLTGVETRLR